MDESCPKCGHPEMEFYTMQLRSADEGTTVFYECRSCGSVVDLRRKKHLLTVTLFCLALAFSVDASILLIGLFLL